MNRDCGWFWTHNECGNDTLWQSPQAWPRITVVTPSYNQGMFLEQTIRSVLDQGYPNLEYMVIDGGSTDCSKTILDHYADRLSFVCSEPDGGQYDAINKGFARATGDILAWLNSDDMYFPWALHTVGSIMHAIPDVDWLSSLAPAVWDFHGNNTKVLHFAGFSRDAFLDGCYLPLNRNFIGWIQQESTFWRRGLWEKTGRKLDVRYTLAADFDLWTRFFEHADLVGVGATLGGFRVHDSQRSRNFGLCVQEAVEALHRARRAMGWKSSVLRAAALACRLDRMPIAARLYKRLLGYHGKWVTRADGGGPSGRWVMAEQVF